MKNIKGRLRAINEMILIKPSILSLLLNPAYFARKSLWKNIEKNSTFMNGILLDFGCGSKPYEDLLYVEKYIGIDIVESGHEHINENIDCYYDGKTIPFSDGFFDCVLSSQVFEHIFNLDDILGEINRVLKSNGYLLITVPFVWGEHEQPYDFGRYTSFGIKYIMERHGFKIVDITKSTNYVEAVFQMWSIYINSILPRKWFLHTICTLLFIAPINLIGCFLSSVLPKNYDFYNDNIVIAVKI